MPEDVNQIDIEPLLIAVNNLNDSVTHTLTDFNSSVSSQIAALSDAVDLLTAVSVSLFILFFVSLSIKFLFSK